VIPTRLLFRAMRQRQERGEPFTEMEAWGSLDYDFYRHGELASERAYAALWKRHRDGVRKIMRDFRAWHGLPDPPHGRRPSHREPPLAPRDHYADQSIDQVVDRVSAAYSMPCAQPDLQRAGHSVGHSAPASKKQRL